MTCAFDHTITGIGSLPHATRDSAIEYSFRHSLPFLPQIPIRNPKEFMLPHALESLPGVHFTHEGTVMLGACSRTDYEHFETKLNLALKDSRSTFFEPSSESCSLWAPFLYECEVRKIQTAKIQICGPMTAQWAIQFEPGITASDSAANLISKLIFARALAMVRRLKSLDITPIVFVDEPALYVFSAQRPDHQIVFQELGFLLQALKNEGAVPGLHSCSNADWERVLALPALEVLSFDTALSFESITQCQSALNQFIERGGTLSLGILPGTDLSREIQSLKSKFSLKHFTLTAPCGLAFNTIPQAEAILESLQTTLKGIAL